MKEIVSTIRANDRRRNESCTPNYETGFPNGKTIGGAVPISSAPVPDSIAENQSETSSQGSLAAAVKSKCDLGDSYQPSQWYYEAGPNVRNVLAIFKYNCPQKKNSFYVLHL